MKDGMKADNLRVATLVADSTNAGAGEIGATELASDAVTTAKILDANVTTAKITNDAVTSAKLAISYNTGHFTLGTNGAEVYVGFSGGRVAVDVGSPMTINIDVLGASAAVDEAPFVTTYDASGFTASGNVEHECMYQAFEEG